MQLLLDQKSYHETCLEIIKTNIPSVQATIGMKNNGIFASLVIYADCNSVEDEH